MMSFQTLVPRSERQQADHMSESIARARIADAPGSVAENGPGMPGYEWAGTDQAPVRELFPGVRLRSLWQGDNGATAHVLDMAPGSCWPRVDLHQPGPEEVFVLSGTFHDGVRAYPAGTFLHAPANSWHIPQTTTGCTLFVFYPEG
jgi:anti-sigma factor ChrR (cupin superfamily)